MNQTDPSRTDDHAAPAAAPAAGAAPGPYAQRLREAYLNEGMALLGEGVPAELIEQTAIELGMPAGPLLMLDEVSLQTLDEALHRRLDGHDHEHGHGHGHGHGREPAQDHRHGVAHEHEHEHEHGHGHGHQHQAHAHGHPHADHAPGPGEAHVHGHNDSSHDGHAHDHVHSHGQEPASAASAPGAAWPPAPPMPESAVYVLEKMAHGYRRMGRAAGRGFYDYLPGEPASLWPGLSAFARGATPISAQDARDRLLYAQAIEAARCLHDGLIGSASEADAVSLREAGFPAWTGGAAHLVDHVGAARFVKRADELAARYGERFRVPASLRARAADSAAR